MSAPYCPTMWRNAVVEHEYNQSCTCVRVSVCNVYPWRHVHPNLRYLDHVFDDTFVESFDSCACVHAQCESCGYTLTPRHRYLERLFEKHLLTALNFQAIDDTLLTRTSRVS